MATIDLRSLVLMSGLMGLLLAFMLFFLRLSYPRSIRGLGLWSAAHAWVFLSTLLFAGRGFWPDFVTIVLANLVLLAGIVSYHAGVARFFGRQVVWWRWVALLLVLAPVLYWYGLVDPNYNARLIVVCLVWSGIFLSMAWLIWRHGPRTFPTRFTVATLLLHVTVLLLRFFSAWVPMAEEGLLTPTRVQSLYVGSNALMLLALGMGMILLAGDRLRAEFEHIASHDPLTNVLTRRVFMDACAQELARCRRHGRSMALLLMDIDHFKVVNDTHGHQMGDRVLLDFAQRITALLRRPDLLARFGGEEFVLLLPETSQEEAVAVAERILARVAEPADGLPSITVSIGLATNRPDEAEIDTLLARADRALYKAKDEGRSRVEVA
ncbi:MAG: GGDEF domain-containing protein [Hylemonella sp.]|uniref:GGDEF domain-containing protein n=1 Tax=Hylemonella sp. TaxID=2066020 RepID=UPI0022C147A5|nr:GGDEF domain-containing protein [Hylemonella sp.]MCZ8252235.1 GGDEF domain-containing protein [Hylemonella sp.]